MIKIKLGQWYRMGNGLPVKCVKVFDTGVVRYVLWNEYAQLEYKLDKYNRTKEWVTITEELPNPYYTHEEKRD